MTKIFPKANTNLLEAIPMIEYFQRYQGGEIHLHNFEEDIEGAIQNYFQVFGVLNEITLHAPTCCPEIELLLLHKKVWLHHLCKRACELSCKYQIQINLLFHVASAASNIVAILTPFITQLIEEVRGFNVMFLLENNMRQKEFAFPGLYFCSAFQHPKVKACLNITHYRSMATLYHLPPKQFLKGFLMEDILSKREVRDWIYQIHVASHHGDGIRDKKTHSRAHQCQKDLNEEMKLLDEAGIRGKVYVTEVTEEDYLNPKEQLQELHFLEEYLKNNYQEEL